MLPYLIGAAVVAAALVALGAPLASVAPFAIVLLCPLMMVVMMRSMGGMGGMHAEKTTPGTAASTIPPAKPSPPPATGHKQPSPSNNFNRRTRDAGLHDQQRRLPASTAPASKARCVACIA
jgi:hypothetical protein